MVLINYQMWWSDWESSSWSASKPGCLHSPFSGWRLQKIPGKLVMVFIVCWNPKEHCSNIWERKSRQQNEWTCQWEQAGKKKSSFSVLYLDCQQIVLTKFIICLPALSSLIKKIHPRSAQLLVSSWFQKQSIVSQCFPFFIWEQECWL